MARRKPQHYPHSRRILGSPHFPLSGFGNDPGHLLLESMNSPDYRLRLRWFCADVGGFSARRLLAPFRDSLLANVGLHGFKESAYYAGSFMTDKATGEKMPVSEALPELRKQVVLIGESGLGKTMFLRHLGVSAGRKMRDRGDGSDPGEADWPSPGHLRR